MPQHVLAHTQMAFASLLWQHADGDLVIAKYTDLLNLAAIEADYDHGVSDDAERRRLQLPERGECVREHHTRLTQPATCLLRLCLIASDLC